MVVLTSVLFVGYTVTRNCAFLKTCFQDLELGDGRFKYIKCWYFMVYIQIKETFLPFTGFPLESWLS